MADRAVNWGDSVSAVCTVVNGDSPLEISWALDSMPIDESHRISVITKKRNSLLSIDSASPSHAGTYTCVASNEAGATSYSAELTVNGTLNATLDRQIHFRNKRTRVYLPSFFRSFSSLLSLLRARWSLWGRGWGSLSLREKRERNRQMDG